MPRATRLSRAIRILAKAAGDRPWTLVVEHCHHEATQSSLSYSSGPNVTHWQALGLLRQATMFYERQINAHAAGAPPPFDGDEWKTA